MDTLLIGSHLLPSITPAFVYVCVCVGEGQGGGGVGGCGGIRLKV